MTNDHQQRKLCLSVFLAFPLWSLAQPMFAQTEPAMQMTPLTYPETQRGDVVDDYFGTEVADPYRWLENEASSDAKVVRAPIRNARCP